MHKIYLTLLVLMAMVSCSSSEEKKVEGDRILVFSGQSSDLKNDKGAIVQLPIAVNKKNWPMQGSDSAHVSGHLELGQGIEKSWSLSLSDFASADDFSSPVVKNDKLFVVDGKATVFAIDLKEKKESWKVNVALNDNDYSITGGGLAATDSKIFAVTAYGECVAIDSQNGKVLWRLSVPSPAESAPVIDKNHLFLSTKANQLVAIDIESKKIIWVYNGLQQTVGLKGGAAPAVFDQTVVAGLSSGEVVAVHSETGRTLWFDTITEKSIFGLSDIVADPVLYNNLVFVSPSSDGNLIAFNLASGVRIWEKPFPLTQSPTVAGNALFLVTKDAKLAAVLINGALSWQKDLPTTDYGEAQRWFSPVVAGATVMVVSDSGALQLINPANGDVINSVSLGFQPIFSPIIIDKQVIFVTNSGNIVVYKSEI